VRRLTILLATVGALLLVPAAQAFATAPVTIHIKGSGSGEVSSTSNEEEEEILPGEPLIECNYESPGPATGTCNDEASVAFEFYEGIKVYGHAAEGSKFLAWEVNWSATGEVFVGGCGATKNTEPNCFIAAEGPGTLEEAEITATFCLEGQTEEECLAPAGPTNRAPLTITKSAGGTGGIGSVTSKPKGINCGSACNSAVASMYKNTPVVLTAKPSTGSSFVEWTGACSGASTTCTVPMAAAESVGAVFGGTSKEILNPQPLTLDKGESTGYGTVKASGLACEAECSSTVALYQGPTGVAPKNKPGKTVELKATAAWGSTFGGWSGACSGSEAVCLVTMEEAESVTATFTANPVTTLTLNKGGSGNGAVSSKPKAINCGTTCPTQDAAVPEESAIVLKEKPGTGMTFTGWSGGGCSGTAETCTVSLSAATTVTASFSGSPKPILNEQELTLTKAGSGYGTVKAAGMKCEALCTSTVSLYQGPTGVAPKNKPGKTVVLIAASAPGSKAVEWSGCESNPTPTECSVTMEAAEEVTATFNEIE
jgi:hypothetical protein